MRSTITLLWLWLWLSLLSVSAGTLRKSPSSSETKRVRRGILADIPLEKILRKDEPRHNTTPLFWHVHKTGGTTVKVLVSCCLEMTVASESGRGHAHETKLGVFERKGNHKFVNVDLSNVEGVDRAEQIGFVGDALGMADVMFSGPLANILDKLYTEDHKASVFTILRHPVDRAVSTFYYLQKANWENSYRPEWQNLTLEEYANLPGIEENWLVRWLSGKPPIFGDPLDYLDLEKAKTIIRDYMWVGLIEEMEESMQRFGQLYGWNRRPLDRDGKWEGCLDSLVRGDGGSNRNNHQSVTPQDGAYQALAEVNKWDMMLYEYAVEVFHQEGQHFGKSQWKNGQEQVEAESSS